MDSPLPPLARGATDSSTRPTSPGRHSGGCGRFEGTVNMRPEAQSQGEERESPKQYIGLSKLDTKERAFRYLDFAEGGVSAALNKWGQFLKFSRLVVSGGDPDSWCYISVEPRNISRLEHIIPAPTSHEAGRGEEEDEEGGQETAESKSRALGWEPDNPEWKPSQYYTEYPAYPRRHDKFNALCVKNQGLGLRFSDNTNISEPEHYYRNDRWPEVRYTVEGKVKVVLQHYIRDGEIIQDMCLTSESRDETELSLEFEFTTGIRISSGETPQPRGREDDAPDHFLERVTEGEAPGSHWKLQRDNYYATASLFEDGKPKSFSLLGDDKQNDTTKCDINILSDDPIIRHRETFILKRNARVKFTTVFKLDHQNVPNIPPRYFDISPHLKLFGDRWWSFKTDSAGFIFRRTLETALSHAMPLPKLDDETYQPCVPHDHDLASTYHTWGASMEQLFYLLEIYKLLRGQNTADDVTKFHYRERIRKVIFGYLVWVLRHAELIGFPDSVVLHWSGKVDESGELVGEANSEEKKDIPHAPAEKSSLSEVVEPPEPVGIPRAKIDRTDSLLSTSIEAQGSIGDLNKASTSHPGKTEETTDPPPVRPTEPDIYKYSDSFPNCCRFLDLLDMCLTNYPDEKPLITRMVKSLLKTVWETIEMSKHRGCDLWPDRFVYSSEYPPPYARFWDLRNYENCGYARQNAYVYSITTQVLVWRAVRSMNRLLGLVSGDRDWSEWMVHQSLDDKAIRDRTIEAFRRPGTDTSHDCFPDRFFSIIEGHIKESLPNQWSCEIGIPSFVEDFFFDGRNQPISAWTETLRYYDTFNHTIKARTQSTWEYFTRYLLTIDGDRRQELREGLEARAYSVGVFGSGVATPGSHCPSTTGWDMATYFLSVDYAKFLYPQFRIPMIMDPPTRADGPQVSMPPQEDLTNAGTTPSTNAGAGVRQGGRKSGKMGNGFDITVEDRRQLHDPPSYGEWYCFRDPLFMAHKPEKFEMNKEFMEGFLVLGDCFGNWCSFWETGKGKEKFLKSMADTPNYDWGGERNALVKPSRNGNLDRFRGGKALLKLQEKRDCRTDKKRILVMKDCMIQHLISLMANLDFQEAGHISEFLSRLRHTDSHKMRFEEKTLMPDNLWITEFNINFITAPSQADVESPLLPNYFPRRRAKFLSMNDTAPDRIMAEAAMGFRIIGDLHDRYWTCYVFYDYGSRELVRDAWSQYDHLDSCKTPSQRKCLEGFLVRHALDLVLSEAKLILGIITKPMGGNKKSQSLFNPLLTEDDLSGENYFKTMNKNSVFYPWLLEVYSALLEKCKETRSVAEQWISAEKTREYKPRWSEKDQKSFGGEVAKNRADVIARCVKLEKMAKNLQERIDRNKTLKESLSSELALREARTSTQLAHTVNLFAVVTTIYLPLTFSTSIVAIQDLHWKSPAKALVRITLAVTFGTLILLVNLAFLRRHFTTLKTWVQDSIRQRMEGTSEPKGSASKELIYQEKQPAWKYWKERARGLHEAEKRSTLLTDNVTHDGESNWWYWYFMAIYIAVVVPVKELTFIIRTLRFQKIKDAGPLKKLVRLPWAPIWILQLALVYVVILAGHTALSLSRLAHRTAVWLWTGNDGAESCKAAQEEEEEDRKSLVPEPEADDKSLKPEPDSTNKGGVLAAWFKKPAKIMQLLIVAEALPSKKKEIDEEKQETAVEATAKTAEVPSST